MLNRIVSVVGWRECERCRCTACCAHKTKSQNKNKFYAPHFLKTLVRGNTCNKKKTSRYKYVTIFSNMQKYYFPRFHKSVNNYLSSVILSCIDCKKQAKETFQHLNGVLRRTTVVALLWLQCYIVFLSVGISTQCACFLKQGTMFLCEVNAESAKIISPVEKCCSVFFATDVLQKLIKKIKHCL